MGISINKSLETPFFIHKSIYGFVLGFCMSWLLFLLYRCFWDGQNPLVLAEFWLVVIFNIFTIYLWPYFKIFYSKNKTSVLAFFGYSIFILLGCFSVFIWHLQNMEKNITYDTTMHRHYFINTSSIISSMSDENDVACSSIKDFINKAVIDNKSWNMDVFEKLWIKESLLKINKSGCLSDNELFLIVRKLSTRPLSPQNKMSSVSTWTFPSNINPSTQNQLIPIRRYQWCIHQYENKEISFDLLTNACHELEFSDEIILKPESINLPFYRD